MHVDRRIRIDDRTRVIVVVAVFLAGACSGSSTPPPELEGLYTSDDPEYAGRSFSIGTATFEIQTSPGDVESHPIESVYYQAERDGRKLLELTYRNQHRQEHTMSFYDEGDGVLVMKNRPGVRWSRREGSR